MTWKTIDFQGIVSLDTPLVELLNKYLDEKESELARKIIESVPPSHEGAPTPALPSPSIYPLKLSDAFEAFARQHYENRLAQISLEDWKSTVKEINKALWDYVEVLEGCVTELFQQLEQATLEQWHTRIAQVVGTTKETLLHKMENLIWLIRRLEDQLWKCRLSCEQTSSLSSLWYKMSPLFSSLLDRKLISQLTNTQEILRSQYQKFIKRYDSYVQLLTQVEKEIDALTAFPHLCTLDLVHYRQFLQLYQLLKLWDLNRSTKALPSQDFIIALRNETNVDKASFLFKEYYKALQKDLFAKSLQFKEHAAEMAENMSERNRVQENLELAYKEAVLLKGTVHSYRDFLLSTDPDPYVRTRLGFSEWNTGPEPALLKPLLNLEYDLESLCEQFEGLISSLKEPSSVHTLEEFDQEIQRLLHEMSQPLATYRMMRGHAESILEKLQKLNELGSSDNNIVPYVGQLFSRLLRADWRYNVLHGIPLFHQLYAIHQGLIPPISDRQHGARLIKFQRLLDQVQEWVKTQKTQNHAHDIELDISDIRAYLQDFLALVQRIYGDVSLPKEQLINHQKEFSQELLEYRYLFGNFFYQLRQHESEGPLIRKQFLFVDQYFESVDYRLHNLSLQS